LPAIRKSRNAEPKKWIDVEWEPEPGKLFERIPVDHGAELPSARWLNCHRHFEVRDPISST
jgi:hypothetical protein